MKLKAELLGKFVNVIGFAVWMRGKGSFRWAAIMSFIYDAVMVDSLDGRSLVKVHAH